MNDDYDDMAAEELDEADLEMLQLLTEVRAEDHERFAPPEDLWARIDAAVRAEETPSSSVATIEAAPTVGVAPGPATAGEVVPLARHSRSKRRWIGVVGGLAVAASLVAAVWLVARPDSGGRELARTELSNEGLAPFPVAPMGTAVLIDDGGQLLLEVDVQDLEDDPSAYYEIWLIDTSVEGMVSLGPYHGRDRYPVPPSVDPSAFPVVDVSLEPTDGTPTHSGVSAVRGVLPL
jgi:hypothetical protein